jgi:uncharacterized protein YndB with AHSA1/START domain
VKDILDDLAAADRSVIRRDDDGTELVVAGIGRVYDAPVDDVWDAIVDPARLRRWFAPVSGDLRAGGSYQIEGNAGGEIRRCEPPRALGLTWGGAESLVEVRLTPDGDRTRVELTHSVPVAFVGSGAGALYVGPGWDIAVLTLGRHLAGADPDDPAAWEGSPEGQRFAVASAEAWARAVLAGGTGTAEEVDGAMAAARAQFAPDLAEDGEAVQA